MTRSPFSLPNAIVNTEQANQFAELSLNEEPVLDRILKLEAQTIFWLMVEALEHPDIVFKSIELSLGDDPDDSVFVELSGVDPDDDITICDETEEIAAALPVFIENSALRATGRLEDMTPGKMTHENKWEKATELFGDEVASEMKQDYIARRTPQKTKHHTSPRI